MLADLNSILDGLGELEEKGVESIDCRRAQFSAQEPIIRLRMICQSWKVMFQAEYSSGQPLRMLVDLRAAVDEALGRGAVKKGNKKSETPAPPASAPSAAPGKAAATTAPRAAAAAAAAGSSPAKASARPSQTPAKEAAKPASPSEVTEFDVSAAPEWNPDADTQTKGSQ